ncbi:MAG: DUF2125 domain-containing protein [Rhodovulum sp.]|nr:DUF2125 domain-containing protein [Rhodovulum sp.]
MRKLLSITIVLALLWAGYWFVAARGLDKALNAGIEAQRAAGWTIAYDDLSVSGFPNRLDTTLTAPTITAPTGDFGWSAPFFQVLTLSYRPNHIIAVWPETQTLTLPDLGKVTVLNTDMRASAVVRAEGDLTLDRANLVAEQIAARFETGDRIAADKVLLALRATEEPTTYDVAVDATGLSAADHVITATKVNARIGLSQPLNRFALAPLPHATRVDLDNARIEWGETVVTATGGFDIDLDGYATGALTLGITNWRAALSMAQDMGAMRPADVQQATRVLRLLAASDGDDTTLDVPLSLRGGQVWLGPINLGRMPRLR